jgi:hypothetical protein
VLTAWLGVFSPVGLVLTPLSTGSGRAGVSATIHHVTLLPRHAPSCRGSGVSPMSPECGVLPISQEGQVTWKIWKSPEVRGSLFQQTRCHEVRRRALFMRVQLPNLTQRRTALRATEVP